MEINDSGDGVVTAAEMFDLSGKLALVSGASRGIGEQVARLLAGQGANVIVSSRRIDECSRVAESIRQAGGEAEAIACHVGDLSSIEALFTHIRNTWGRLDICVNNAATNPYYGHVLDTDPEAFTKTVDVNLRGYFFMSVEAGRLMRDNNGGVIVNTASVNALSPAHLQGVYSITKAAVVNMTSVFAKECAQFGIRCNAILPGLTRTRFAGALFENDETCLEAIKQIPMGRPAEPREMAGTVLYLVSDASSYTNGACVVVDGGMTA